MEAGGDAAGDFQFERDIDFYIPVEVTETRITGAFPSPTADMPNLLLTHYSPLSPILGDEAIVSILGRDSATSDCTNWALQSR
jgi:hypothetical protein